MGWLRRQERWIPGTWRGSRPRLSVMVLGRSPLALTLARAVATCPAVVMVHGAEERPVAATVLTARPDLLILCDPADPALAEHVLEACSAAPEPPTTRLVLGVTHDAEAVLQPLTPLGPFERDALSDVLAATARQLAS